MAFTIFGYALLVIIGIAALLGGIYIFLSVSNTIHTRNELNIVKNGGYIDYYPDDELTIKILERNSNIEWKEILVSLFFIGFFIFLCIIMF